MSPDQVKTLLHNIARTMEGVSPLVALESPAVGSELMQAGQAIDAISLEQITSIFDKVQTGVDVIRTLIGVLQGKGLGQAAEWLTAWRK